MKIAKIIDYLILILHYFQFKKMNNDQINCI